MRAIANLLRAISGLPAHLFGEGPPKPFDILVIWVGKELRLGNQDVIMPLSKKGLVPAEEFPGHPFGPVSLHGFWEPPLADADSYPGESLTVGEKEDRQARYSDTLSLFEDPVELPLTGQPYRSWKPLVTVPLCHPPKLSPSALSYTVRRRRPFARRLLKTLLPALVLIRFLNPWVLFLFRLLG